MAVGDMIADIQSIAAAAYLDVQPSGTVEAVIHNIWHEDDITISRYDGTNAVALPKIVGAGLESNLQIHVGNTDRIRVQNNHASAAKLIGYDGMVTHT